MKKWLLLLLIVVLPIVGAAAQENEVVALPTVAPLETVEVSGDTDYSAASLKEYYDTSYYGWEGENYQAPYMTAAERERAGKLLAAYQAGERPRQNVLNKLENAVVGVYTLNPEDYEGETLFTIIPVDPLTDEQILEIIDAFAQCGLTFDPEALSWQNCMRGGGIEVSRFMQEEERERWQILTDLYIRQGFVSEAPYTPLVSDDGLGIATLDPDSYCGMEEFCFFPCRRMTDDELLAYAIYTESGDPAEYSNYAAYEKQLRLELTRLLGAPLVMTRLDESVCRMGDCSVNYDDEKVYYAAFLTPDGTQYSGYLDIDTKQVLMANQWNAGSLVYSDLYLDPFDEKWLDIAKDAVTNARGDGMVIRSVESYGETWLQDAGHGVSVRVTMEDGSYYNVRIAYQNEEVFGGLWYESRLQRLDRMYPDGMFE